MKSEDITVLMGGHGFPNAGRIPYHGGLDDVDEGISIHLPQNYKIHVLAHSSGEDEVIYKPKENVWVHGSPGIPFRAGEEYGHLYTPLGRHCDDFMAHALDSKIYALKNIVPDIIKNSKGDLASIMHDYFSGPLGIELKKKKIPFIFQSHLSADRKPFDPYYSNIDDLRLFYEEVSCKEADYIIAVSEHTKESIVNAYKTPPEKVTVIENAIDTNIFRPSTEEERARNYEYLGTFGISESDDYLLWTGRFVEEKGTDNALRAFEIFSPEHSEYKMVLAGFGGNTYQGLMEIRNNMPEKVRDRVIIINQQVNVLPFNQECAFALCPSRREAFGLVATKAGACEKAVIAGNGGLRKNVKDRVTGMHINPDSPQSIAEGMEIVHQNKEEWGKNARGYVVQNYSWDVAIPKYEAVITKALAST